MSAISARPTTMYTATCSRRHFFLFAPSDFHRADIALQQVLYLVGATSGVGCLCVCWRLFKFWKGGVAPTGKRTRTIRLLDHVVRIVNRQELGLDLVTALSSSIQLWQRRGRHNEFQTRRNWISVYRVVSLCGNVPSGARGRTGWSSTSTISIQS